MGDETGERLICENCGLPILAGERAHYYPGYPCHSSVEDCLARLRAELYGTRLSAAAKKDDALRIERALAAALDDARRDLAAALAVVRAARIVRVRYRREERAEKLYTRAYYAPGVFPAELAEERRRAYDESCDAREVLVAATTAYVKGGAR